jgi:sugar O-acyltransferase (sialic acid O-acetyltransferase NeuD family)
MSAEKDVYVIGAGGHAKVVIRMLQDLGHRVAAVFDDNPRLGGATLVGCPVFAPVERIRHYARCPAIIAIGDNATRRRIADRYDLPWMTAVHPLALVDRSVRLGVGTVVFARAVVQVDSSLGDHVIVNHAATVDHDCRVGDCVHLAPGVHLAGGVTVHEGALMGIGAVAIPGTRIGTGAIVGAGAVVTDHLPEQVVAAGVPARVIKPVPRAVSEILPVFDLPGHVGLGTMSVEP